MTREEALAILDTIPTIGEQVDALEMAIEALQERKTGKWIDTGSGQECSCCGEIQYGYDNGRRYCPNCGAKMEVDE